MPPCITIALSFVEASDAVTDDFSIHTDTEKTTATSTSKQQLHVSSDTIHTLCTSNGSPYLNYQTRIM